jgi:beta-lactamase regulating signal transducer with metallopeptidase domain
MIIAVVLFGYALLVATVGAWLLRGADWPAKAPRLAIALWQGLAASSLLSTALGAAALSVRQRLVSNDLSALFDVCATDMRADYATPGGITTTVIALVALALIAGRTIWGITTTLSQALRRGRRQLQIVDLIAHRDQNLDVLVIDHPTPAAFCLPGREQQVVVTNTALTVLSSEEVDAVLAHERAHLHGRHHFLLAVSRGLARAFPGIPVFTWGDQQVRRLVELAADDGACRNHQRTVVASAIRGLAETTTPTAAPASSRDATQLRVRRLTDRWKPLHLLPHAALYALVAAELLGPALIAALPALILTTPNYC